jgi:hypothetical protein
MEGVPDFPHPHSKRIELIFSHEEIGSLTKEVFAAPVTFGPPQAEGTGESGGLLCKGYMDTSTLFSLCFPHQHCWWVSYPPYPSFIVSYFHQVIGWPSGLSTAQCVLSMFE